LVGLFYLSKNNKKEIEMFKKKFLTVLALVAFAVIGSKAYAELAVVTASPGVQDEYEINNMTPGSAKTFLGTRLKGPLQTGTTTRTGATTACANGAKTVNAVSTTLTTTAYSLTTGSDCGESISLENGFQNQEVTFVLTTDGGKNFRITPVTKTGFTNIELDDVRDSATVKYIDDTTGWVIKGNNGATIN
jgi:hypothetical protein